MTSGASATVPVTTYVTWVANESALTDVTFPASNWTGNLTTQVAGLPP